MLFAVRHQADDEQLGAIEDAFDFDVEEFFIARGQGGGGAQAFSFDQRMQALTQRRITDADEAPGLHETDRWRQVGGQNEAVEKETYQVLDANGNWVTDPDHVTLIFTVTTTTPTAEVMTTKVGDQEVRIGKTDYILKSEYIEFSDGTITNVIWGD